MEKLELQSNGTIKGYQEIGNSAVWTLSTAKLGADVHHLLDSNPSTFWQSDGNQPHFVSIQFPRRLNISAISLLIYCSQDESYTPQNICVKAGTIFNDLCEVKSVELKEPEGWQLIDLRNADGDCVFVSLLQISILANHQYGRDSRIRMIKVHGGPSAETGFVSTDDFDDPEIRLRNIVR